MAHLRAMRDGAVADNDIDCDEVFVWQEWGEKQYNIERRTQTTFYTNSHH